MLGLNGATANYACAWCKIQKDDRWKTDQHFSYFNSKPLSRSFKGRLKVKESYPIPSYYGFPYILWFFQMYQVVTTFTGQGVEIKEH